MELTDQQKELLCELIDGYVYPRFLCQCNPKVDTEGVWDRSKEFLEIRQVLDPDPNFDIEDEDTYPNWFQFGYFEHSNFHKLKRRLIDLYSDTDNDFCNKSSFRYFRDGWRNGFNVRPADSLFCTSCHGPSRFSSAYC